MFAPSDRNSPPVAHPAITAGAPRQKSALIAVGIEACWEIAENSSFVIERYRAATISLDYFGDSVFNSIGDLASCALGFAFAASLPAWSSLAAYLIVEVGMLWLIRDSLLLNVVMLFYPLEFIKSWQQGI